jgi:hypothetical protein
MTLSVTRNSVASSDWIAVNIEEEIMWEEVVVAKFNVASRNFI